MTQAKAALLPMLERLESGSFVGRAALGAQFWVDPYFIGFFYNATSHATRMQFRREPTRVVLEAVFTRTIRAISGSTDRARIAVQTLHESLDLVEGAGDMAKANYGRTLVTALNTTKTINQTIAAFQSIERQIDAAERAREFIAGCEVGVIYQNLLDGTRVFDRDSRVVEGRKRIVANQGRTDGAAMMLWFDTIKQEFDKRYGGDRAIFPASS